MIVFILFIFLIVIKNNIKLNYFNYNFNFTDIITKLVGIGDWGLGIDRKSVV